MTGVVICARFSPDQFDGEVHESSVFVGPVDNEVALKIDGEALYKIGSRADTDFSGADVAQKTAKLAATRSTPV
jgi:hypothetical protein